MIQKLFSEKKKTKRKLLIFGLIFITIVGCVSSWVYKSYFYIPKEERQYWEDVPKEEDVPTNIYIDKDTYYFSLYGDFYSYAYYKILDKELNINKLDINNDSHFYYLQMTQEEFSSNLKSGVYNSLINFFKEAKPVAEDFDYQIEKAFLRGIINSLSSSLVGSFNGSDTQVTILDGNKEITVINPRRFYAVSDFYCELDNSTGSNICNPVKKKASFLEKIYNLEENVDSSCNEECLKKFFIDLIFSEQLKPYVEGKFFQSGQTTNVYDNIWRMIYKYELPSVNEFMSFDDFVKQFKLESVINNYIYINYKNEVKTWMHANCFYIEDFFKKYEQPYDKDEVIDFENSGICMELNNRYHFYNFPHTYKEYDGSYYASFSNIIYPKDVTTEEENSYFSIRYAPHYLNYYNIVYSYIRNTYNSVVLNKEFYDNFKKFVSTTKEIEEDLIENRMEFWDPLPIELAPEEDDFIYDSPYSVISLIDFKQLRGMSDDEMFRFITKLVFDKDTESNINSIDAETKQIIDKYDFYFNDFFQNIAYLQPITHNHDRRLKNWVNLKFVRNEGNGVYKVIATKQAINPIYFNDVIVDPNYYTNLQAPEWYKKAFYDNIQLGILNDPGYIELFNPHNRATLLSALQKYYKQVYLGIK